jgi:hypothetical protein
MTNTPSPEKLLICEGKEDKLFLDQLLKQLSIQVEICTASRSILKDFVTNQQKTGYFKHLKQLAIIRDADFQSAEVCLHWETYEAKRKAQQQSVENTFKSVCDVLKQIGFKAPTKPGQISVGTPRVGIFILPDNTHAGALEDLVVAAMPESQRQCIEQYLTCANNPRQLNRYNKTMVYSWLAAYAKEPEQRLGEAASQLPLTANCFETFGQFLRDVYA